MFMSNKFFFMKNIIMRIFKVDAISIYILPKPIYRKTTEEYKNLLGSACLEKLLSAYDFKSVLDIGCGEGKHSDIFFAHGKKVTAIDYGKSRYFDENTSKIEAIVGDYLTTDLHQFDCIWVSHVLEHTLNVHDFLSKIFTDLKEGGILAITVPPMHFNVVGGHINLFTPGLLLYRLILAGFDCKEARLLSYEYNISIIVKKVSNNVISSNILNYDYGDIKKLKNYFPKYIQGLINDSDFFNLDIEEINWV